MALSRYLPPLIGCLPRTILVSAGIVPPSCRLYFPSSLFFFIILITQYYFFHSPFLTFVRLGRLLEWLPFPPGLSYCFITLSPCNHFDSSLPPCDTRHRWQARAKSLPSQAKKGLIAPRPTHAHTLLFPAAMSCYCCFVGTRHAE
ncbi:hypothetical protein IF2G_06937 [Cordyceps javanica]|nr:hypothetical protein IF2G_06937 [Cordyceps javanica]